MDDAGSVLFSGLVFLWLLLVLVGVASLVLSIWVIVDAAQRPDWQFQVTGQSKALWIVLGVVGVAVCQVVGVVAGPIYLLSVRKRLAEAPMPLYGYPYPGAPGYPAAGGGYPWPGASPYPPAEGPRPGPDAGEPAPPQDSSER